MSDSSRLSIHQKLETAKDELKENFKAIEAISKVAILTQYSKGLTQDDQKKLMDSVDDLQYPDCIKKITGDELLELLLTKYIEKSKTLLYQNLETREVDFEIPKRNEDLFERLEERWKADKIKAVKLEGINVYENGEKTVVIKLSWGCI